MAWVIRPPSPPPSPGKRWWGNGLSTKERKFHFSWRVVIRERDGERWTNRRNLIKNLKQEGCQWVRGCQSWEGHGKESSPTPRKPRPGRRVITIKAIIITIIESLSSVPGAVLTTSQAYGHSILLVTLQDKNYCPHCIEQGQEMWRDLVTCPIFQNGRVRIWTRVCLTSQSLLITLTILCDLSTVSGSMSELDPCTWSVLCPPSWNDCRTEGESEHNRWKESGFVLEVVGSLGKKWRHCCLPLAMHPLNLFEGVVGCLGPRGEAALGRDEWGTSGEAWGWGLQASLTPSGWRDWAQERGHNEVNSVFLCQTSAPLSKTDQVSLYMRNFKKKES